MLVVFAILSHVRILYITILMPHVGYDRCLASVRFYARTPFLACASFATWVRLFDLVLRSLSVFGSLSIYKPSRLVSFVRGSGIGVSWLWSELFGGVAPWR